MDGFAERFTKVITGNASVLAKVARRPHPLSRLTSWRCVSPSLNLSLGYSATGWQNATPFQSVKVHAPKWCWTLSLRGNLDPNSERTRRGSVLDDARTPSKKSHARSPSRHLTQRDGSSIQAKLVLSIQSVPEHTTTLIVDQHTQKSISPLLVTTNVNFPPLRGELPFKKLKPLTLRLLSWKNIPDV